MKHTTQQRKSYNLANVLGWLSMGLGAAEIALPELLTRMLGFKADRATRHILLACGAREVLAGTGLLTSENKAPWLWARAAGDVIDLALLAAAPRLKSARAANTAVAMAAITGVAACDLMAAALAQQRETPDDQVCDTLAAHGQQVRATVTVMATPREAYTLWRDFAGLPRFMRRIATVEVDANDANISHWEATGPAGVRLGWDAELTEDQVGTCIAWRSRAGSELLNAGRATFARAPGGQSTEVCLAIKYEPPMGPIGAALAQLARPQEQLRADLRRFKQLLELGEIVISDGTLSGEDERPAQPAHLPARQKRKRS